jgi:predicted component of type VI protein secretion system
MIRIMIGLVLVLAGCGAADQARDPEPECVSSSVEASPRLAGVCGAASNPIVVQCDRPILSATGC